MPFYDRFYVIPGKQIDDVSVEIETEINENGEHKVLGVYFEGNNIIREDDKQNRLKGFKGTPYQNMWFNAFVDMLSEDMVVQKRIIGGVKGKRGFRVEACYYNLQFLI
ncbi:MAG: hypothetical protein EF812_07590 [Methanosarcinales archaeon]|nr:MAG: hypothetical protein EF812_07590 [Methanosarcinales archaeon]